MDSNDLFIYAARYDNEDDARGDLEAFQEIASVGVVGKYDTAVLKKTAEGKVKVEKHGTQAKSGGWKGAIAGGVIGLLFPPSILVGALAGGAAGAVTGKLWGGMPRKDLNALGEVLDEGEIGLVIVGESTLDEFVEKALKRAVKRARKVAKTRLADLDRELGA
ncbi:MAG: DUF1269 domain-containing protein [Desulfobacterales bacterium]|jgi:uncharacterized membrane protein